MTNKTHTLRFRVLGVNDDRDFCECCGKQRLKKVVWIEDNETGAIRHYGVNCAQNPAKAFGLKREIQRAERKYQSVREAAYRGAHRRYKERGGKYEPLDRYSNRVSDEKLWEECLAESLQKQKEYTEHFEPRIPAA